MQAKVKFYVEKLLQTLQQTVKLTTVVNGGGGGDNSHGAMQHDGTVKP